MDEPRHMLYCGDMLDILKDHPDKSVDLCFCSPPYENARTYGMEFKLKNEAFIEWCKPRFMECLRVTNGLVCWVINNKTRQFRSSCVVECLVADLHRAGVRFRKTQVFHRVGIPGSGGKDYMRDDWEFILVAQGFKGPLPWSENTACGHKPKWAPGGEMSHRLSNGDRRNEWGGTGHSTGGEGRNPDGTHKTRKSKKEKLALGAKVHTKNGDDGMMEQVYLPPKIANPGNVWKCKVGGGLMGSPLAHENEAPFPESLAEKFVLSFCRPGGIVLDPFCGSGTTGSVAIKHGRRFMGIDIRESQIELTNRRLDGVQKVLC